MQYWRLPEGLPSTDPFNGMYLANYGSHGPELLRLYREVVDDEELVIAQKLTGAGRAPGSLRLHTIGPSVLRCIVCRLVRAPGGV